MKRIFLFFYLILITCHCISQKLDIGVFAGGTNYNGELQEKVVDLKMMHLALGASLSYHVNDRLTIRGNAMRGRISGADRLSSKTNLRQRNLSFESRIYELAALGKYRLLSPERSRIIPFVNAGLAFFRVNPYAYDQAYQITYLYPLSTEGQGLPEYPNRKAHSLYHFSIPVGGGLEFLLGNRWSLEFEYTLRKTFTDYIDDVSTTYIDPIVLFGAKGFKAVQMSYRSPEVGGDPVHPDAGRQRGNAGSKDLYYSGVFRINYSLFGGERTQGRGGRTRSKYRARTDCPTVW